MSASRPDLDTLLSPTLSALDDRPEALGMRWWSRPLHPTVAVWAAAVMGFVPGSALVARNYFLLGDPRLGWRSLGVTAVAVLLVAGLFLNDPRLMALVLFGPFNLPAIALVVVQAHRQPIREATLPMPWWTWLLLIGAGVTWIVAFGWWLFERKG